MTFQRTRLYLSVCLGLVFVVSGTHWASAEPARPDISIAEFEGDDYGAWKAEGDAFGSGPAKGTLPGQMEVSGFDGHGLVNSFRNGDGSTGTLTSPPILIERRYINFLVGGGKLPGQTCIDLLVDGKVVRSATGPNDAPGGTERLDWASWDVSEFAGKSATVRITDTATGGWGHINVDHIIESDVKPPIPVVKTRTITLDKNYLLLPTKNGATKVRFYVEVDAKTVRSFDFDLASDTPDYWVAVDVRPFKGKSAVLKADRLPEKSVALDAAKTDDAIPGAAELYREPLRPQFHFTTQYGWINDPNGLVLHDGEYHFFYQHNPYGRNWGNMHWGHAVSPDLLHWNQLPDAIGPDELGTIFSGSAVVDLENTAGFNKDGHAAIVCMYTAAGDSSPESKGQPFTQCLAYSTDKGRTWTKYAGNPVLKHIIGGNRDPKVIWYERTHSWVLALYLDGEDYALFGSPNLKEWTRLCSVKLPGASECPEFFEIPLDGDKSATKWVFYGGNGRYLVGRFDGKTYTPESGPIELNRGNCFYASQTYNNLPKEDGRRIQVAWAQVEIPGTAFNQMAGFPVELTLHSTDQGPHLYAAPIREIESLYADSHDWKNLTLKPGENPLERVTGDLFDISLVITPKAKESVTLTVRGVPVVYDAPTSTLSCGGKSAPLPPVKGKVTLRILVDRVSIDIFGNDGAVYMPMSATNFAGKNLSLTASGDAQVDSAIVRELKSVWPQAK